MVATIPVALTPQQWLERQTELRVQVKDVTLPVTKSEVIFAVGDPEGISSNSWRLWTSKKGDVYLACRDNFQYAKVSLHASGDWRVAFTSEAVERQPELADVKARKVRREWSMWRRPEPQLPNTVIAFRLFFPESQLGVLPHQRQTRTWEKNRIFIEALPSPRFTAVTLFVTMPDALPLKHESEPSHFLASLDMGNGERAQLIAHGEPEGCIMTLLEDKIAKARALAADKGVTLPVGSYGYFQADRPDRSRYLIGAWTGPAQ
jgi:hypothetical protein